MNKSHGLSLPVSKLRWTCPSEQLPFTRTTKEVRPLQKIVGQDRAVEALEMGARIRSQGYNIWASGVVGTGRMTTVRRILDEVKAERPTLFDFAYVHNFKHPDQPVLLRFPAGEGRIFQRMMDECLMVIRRRIPQLFEEEQFQSSRKKIIQEFQTKEKNVLAEFDQKIRPSGFVLGQLQDESGTRPEIFPVVDGKTVTIDEIDELVAGGKVTEQQAAQIADVYTVHQEELAEIGRRSMRVLTDFRRKIGQFDRAAVGVLLRSVFEEMLQSFPRDRVRQFIEGVTTHILENVDEYVRVYRAKAAGATDESIDESARHLERATTVNLIVDNYETITAPVIVETAPTYASLFGTIEKRMDARGFIQSDFTLIRAGSLLRADGGFLVMNAIDALSDVTIWTSLKRLLLYGRLEIQSADTQMTLTTIKPDHINVDVKVILLGDPAVYLALWAADEDFHKMFKVHAEFEADTPRSKAMIQNYCAFLSHLAIEEGLLHCDRGGASAIIEWAVAFTDSQEKISLQFSYVADLLREATHFARAVKASVVRREHVQHALDMRHRRSSRADEMIREEIVKGRLLIDVKGARVGQINGLTVYSSGIVSFGKPSRITATVSAGNTGIINIEREVQMSGPIHSKGVYILSGLLRSLFSRSQPISFTASVAFEQSYGGVDGDSASAAEMIALLSAIANIPVRQDVAVTGSINQKGDIQPVGGINEKIIGFFEVCRDKGLTGTQGVILPKQNVRDLMLPQEIIDAVKAGTFTIYSIERLEQAIELLMNAPAGRRRTDGTFPSDSVYAKVQSNLSVLHAASKSTPSA
ncbi:MAG: Lon protease family protein [Bacteroidota bacterium]|jgi:lon-related putative ATP-dependent protease